jgi:hypothetical protein
MSSAVYLTNAVNQLASVGFLSKKEAEDCEHNVDDATDIANDLTNFIFSDPDLLLAFKYAIDDRDNQKNPIK